MRTRFRSGLGTRDSGLGKGALARWRFAWVVLAGWLVWGGVVAEQPRVISMAPHLTEMTYAAGVGDRLLGVVDWSDYPPDAAELPSIGDAFRFDLERIMALDPDLALAWRGGTPTQLVGRLEDIGIEVLWVESRSLEDIADGLEVIGRRLGNGQAGRTAAEMFRTELAELAKQDSGKTLTVFYQVSARPLYTLGGRHVINEVFALCGMKNIFAGLDIEASVVDFEAVLAAEPDLIIASRENNDDDPLAQWHESGLLNPQQTSLHRVEPTLLVRPTPRILEGIEHICALRDDLE